MKALTPPPESNGPKSTRVTYFIPTSLAEKVRDVAWWDRESVNSVVVQPLRASWPSGRRSGASLTRDERSPFTGEGFEK
jgi:hypothetical protein